MTESYRDKLNEIDHKCLDEDLKFYDLRSLFESVAPKLSAEDKEEIKKVIQNTNDAETIAAVLQAKAMDEKNESLEESFYVHDQSLVDDWIEQDLTFDIEQDGVYSFANANESRKALKTAISHGYRDAWRETNKVYISGDKVNESLEEDVDSLQARIFDFLDELGGYTDYNQKIKEVSDEFGMSSDEAEGYVWDWTLNSDAEWYDEADKEESLDEKLVDAPQEVIDKLIEILGNYGFILDDSFKVNPGKTFMGAVHLQVINPESIIEDSDEIDVQDELQKYVTRELIDDIHKLDRESNCPITWNFGPNENGQVTGGLDIMKQYIEESYKDIYYIIMDKHGNQLSRPTKDDSELWDRVESRDPKGTRGLKVVVYTGKIDEKLNEASYGGAYDIEDDMFFTKEELMEFGYDLVEQFSAWAEGTCELSDLYMTSPVDLFIAVSDEDGAEHQAKVKIDMRKIKLPKDIYKYSDFILKQWKDSYNEYHDYDESLNESKKVSFDIIIDDEHFTLNDEEADWALEDISAVHIKPSDVAVYESTADADYFILTFKDGTKKAWYIHSGMYIPDKEFIDESLNENYSVGYVKANPYNQDMIYSVSVNPAQKNAKGERYSIVTLHLVCGKDYVDSTAYDGQAWVDAKQFVDDVQLEQIVWYPDDESLADALEANDYVECNRPHFIWHYDEEKDDWYRNTYTESLNEDNLAKPIKKDIKNAYRYFDRRRDFIRKKNAKNIKKIDDMDGSQEDKDKIKDLILDKEPTFKFDNNYGKLETKDYPYYVTYYVEVPYYHPEEGGYYVAGMSAEQSEGFNSKQEAMKAAEEFADELDMQKIGPSSYQLKSKYIGENEYIYVENSKNYLSKQKGDTAYESLNETYQRMLYKNNYLREDYNSFLTLADKDANKLRNEYDKGDKSIFDILTSLNYIQDDPDSVYMYKEVSDGYAIVFDLSSLDEGKNYVKYFVVDENNNIPKGYTITKLLIEDYQQNKDEWGEPYSYDEVERELKSITNNWTDKEGTIRCYWEQEKNYGLQILKKHYKYVETSDGRTGKGEDMSWVLAYSGLKEE